ncbi:uncharacterized protein APUU_41455A [Aspergillus puulaauensis]|uniref:Cytochrome b5 heme-binding domain-containing protein n=1 Tax=Aspergillus puulaauensis TaxID=1220207 RepID=A0A7R7XNX0_9EURO|nr:uncharacterized protein APUU_41455A [Aspergillus puulaauensis]BCS25011.1 hypothetical protein APUU_41455A [Aspergillus puulaauensis]
MSIRTFPYTTRAHCAGKEYANKRRGGDEFLLDQGGQDVTELFEDAEHSKEARQLLGTLLVGDVEDQCSPLTTKQGEQDKGSDLFHYYLYLVLLSLSVLLLACFAVPFDTLHKGLSKHS